MKDEIIVYCKRDANGSIVEIKSNIFIEDTFEWEEIDQYHDVMLLSKEQKDMRYIYAHADNGEYVKEKYKKTLYDEQGRPNFHDAFILWTDEEKAEKYPIPEPEPSEIEKLRIEQEVTAQAVQDLILMMMGG